MTSTPEETIDRIRRGSVRALARSISAVENQSPQAEHLLLKLSPNYSIPVIGVTGSPGAGKSTLLNAMLDRLAEKDYKIAVLAIDPSSPFNLGSLLGDRIRMPNHSNNPNIFIRSLASRGSLGGLSSRTVETVDVLRSAPFDYIFVETVGVGQSEVEIAGLADITMLVTTPESGDDVQLIKAGIMEIASLFVVNKSDLDPDKKYIRELQKLVFYHDDPEGSPPVMGVQATTGEGIQELVDLLESSKLSPDYEKRSALLAARTIRLVQEMQTRNLSSEVLKNDIKARLKEGQFNLYRYARECLESLEKSL